jgi:hypothetical protein
MRKLLQNKLIVSGLLFLTVIASYYKTLGFYFWHDDFTVMYDVVNKNVCSYLWFYSSYCDIFSKLYIFFGYNHFYYFTLAIVLVFVTTLGVYFLAKRLVSPVNAFALALIFASGYIGSGNFLMVSQSITTYLSLSLLLFSLIFFLMAIKKKSRNLFLIIGFVFYVLTLYLVPWRASTYGLLILGFFWIVLRRDLSKKITIFLSVLVILVFAHKFFYEPYLKTGNALMFESRVGLGIIQLKPGFLKQKSLNYFSTVGNYFPIVFFGKDISTFLGFSFHLLVLVAVYANRKRPKVVTGIVFSLFWMASLFIPQALVTGSGLESTNRYTIYSYVGFVLLLGALFCKKEKAFLVLSIALSILNILQANRFFSQYKKAGFKRADFYVQLKKYVKSVPSGSIFYFDAPRGEIARDLSDFFRVGFYGPKASLGTELTTKMENFELVTESKDLSKLVKEGKVGPDNFLSFYYDGNLLLDTTLASKNILKTKTQPSFIKINKSQTTKYKFLSEKLAWRGENNSQTFYFDGLVPVLPFNLVLDLTASLPDFPLPYRQGCVGCGEKQLDSLSFLNYLSSSALIKKGIKVSTDNAGENTPLENLIDDDLETNWVQLRSDWFKGIKPEIKISFSRPTLIDGIVFYTANNVKRPRNFSLKVDGEEVKIDSTSGGVYGVKVITKNLLVKTLDVSVLQTEGDNPSIQEIEIIPGGYADINLETAEKIKSSPAFWINTSEDKLALQKYLLGNARACIEWENQAKKTERKYFSLIPDGRERKYQIELPTLGINTPTFRLGCTSYPVSFKFNSAGVRNLP